MSLPKRRTSPRPIGFRQLPNGKRQPIFRATKARRRLYGDVSRRAAELDREFYARLADPAA